MTQVPADQPRRRTGLEQHQRTPLTDNRKIPQRNAKSGPLIRINGGKIRLASEQQRKHIATATLGSNMTRRRASLVRYVNSRIGSQENVDNPDPTEFGSEGERWWLKRTRQARIDINRTTRNQRLDN